MLFVASVAVVAIEPLANRADTPHVAGLICRIQFVEALAATKEKNLSEVSRMHFFLKDSGGVEGHLQYCRLPNRSLMGH
jgi:hypothetical protein